MRDMSIFDDSSFDIVRNHAALLHIPFTDIGIGATEVFKESYRVLKKNVYYIFIQKQERVFKLQILVRV